jgi:hypothetical protein
MERDSEGRGPKTQAEIRDEKKKRKRRVEAVGLIFLGLGLAMQLGGLSRGERLRHPIWIVVDALLFLFGVAALFSPKGSLGFFHGLFGGIEYVQIYSLEFEQRIRARYQSEWGQLTNLGFAPLFFYGEAFPLIRLLLLFPALVVLMMWLKREVMTVQSGTKFLAGYPVFVSGDKTAYAEANGLGVKFRTAFQDGTLLVTKNYGDATGYAPIAVVQGTKKASICDLWIEHQRRTQALEAEGKRIDRQISFQAFAEISHKEMAV